MQIEYKQVLVSLCSGLLIGLGMGYFGGINEMKPLVTQLSKELDDYKTKYNESEMQREEALILKAKAENEANKPVISPITEKIVTQIQYVEKESESDPDLEINSEPKSILVSYNGRVESLPTTTTEGTKIVNGKVVFNQESTTKLDVTDIVNREIANTIMKKDSEIEKLKRKVSEGKQNTVIGTVVGLSLGIAAGAMSK